MDPLAIYAAVIATLSLAWQISRWYREHGNRVEVAVKFAFLTYGSQLRDTIAIRATNRSEHAVRVISVGLNAQDGSGRTLQPISQIEGATLPGEVGPRDHAEAFIPVDQLDPDHGVDLYRPLTGWVTLATGETIQSKPSTLRQR